MSEQDEVAEWYNVGGPLPVAHPVPECTAQIRFDGIDKLVWEVTDHKKEKTYKETFVFEMQEIDGKLVSNNE